MTKSKEQINEPVMGRADILLRFLQLIGKDHPQDIEPFMDELDDDTEQRPLADQIVDSIIAGDQSLYEKYEQARKDVGPRNPYSSPESQAVARSQEEALGYFLSKWIELETTLRREAEDRVASSRPFVHSISHLIRKRDVFPETVRQQIDYIRQLRNQAVHGIDPPSEATLIKAGESLEEILSGLKNVEPQTSKKAHRRVKPSRKHKSE